LPALAYPLLLLTMLLWGANVVAGKMSVGHISPMLLTTARWAVALTTLWLIGRPQLRADWPAVRRNAVYLGLRGAVGFTLFNIAVYTAVRFTSGINVSVEQGAVPMLIFLINFLVFGLRITWPQAMGLAVSAGGILVVASHGELSQLLALQFN